MIKTLKKQLAFYAAAIAIGGFVATTSQAAFLTWDPTTNNVDLNEAFDVNIHIGGLQANEDLGGFDIDILFDDSMLDFTGYSLYDGLGNITLGDAEDWSNGDTGGGTINLSELSWLTDLSFQSDSFMLATLSFTAGSIGTSSLTFDYVDFSDNYGDPVIYWGNVPGTVDITAAAPVPKPTTMMLFGTGLVGLIGMRRNRKKQ